MNRREFFGVSATLAAASSGRAQPALQPERATSCELDEVSVAALIDRFREGSLTAERAASLYLAQIEAIDRKGPAFRSVIENNPYALTIAESLDEERKAKGARGPVHGVPILLKDGR